MNVRQKEMLRILLSFEKKYILIREMAKWLACSEKTVRNDCNAIEAFLESKYEARLIRKPGVGIGLAIKQEEIAQLHHFLQINNEQAVQKDLTDEDLLYLAYQLLMEISNASIQHLAKDFYVTKTTIKKVLHTLDKWFAEKGIQLVTKQRIGIFLKGSEQNKREALATLDQLRTETKASPPFIYRYFLAYELEIIRKELKKFQEKNILFFTDESLEDITIHLLLMIKRTKMKKPVILTDKEKIYMKSKQEYKWVEQLLLKISDTFQLTFSDDEILYFTIHILGAKIYAHQENSPHSLDRKTEEQAINIADELTKRLTIISLIPFEQDHTLMEGLRIHLYTTLNRLKFGLLVQNPLIQDIKKMYAYMFDMLVFVLQDMKHPLISDIPEDEIAYLTLHYQAAIERIQHKKRAKTKIVIVCHMGIGVAEILRSKIESRFTDVEILATLAKRELHSFMKKNNVDLIITTSPIESVKQDNVVVSPLFNQSDENKVMKMLERNEQSRRQKKGSRLRTFIDPAFVFLQMDSTHRFELIEHLANQLYTNGFVEADYAHQALLRERTSATTIGGGIAIPHGDPGLVKQSTIAVATLKQPIEWDGENVSLVFMLAVKNENDINRRALFQRLTLLAEQPSLVQKLVKEKNKEQFLTNI
ncbi:putative licABCH operon regulator [Paraliobacillus sp. PM-2]|uniref:BglG family transcription antiterminator n=1 Tax=Paraliobacillus sp. PM-2 TaxID=1462524 RepID=UPI00061C51AB|nr:BglG family transcription antiterminator [Paraliobacillus sp. PM-2]CQR47293.1 putative licABCH operon regulator [Paraliobacillus sp. PM-2]